MSSARNNRKHRRNRGRFGLLFKLLCAAALIVAITVGATVFFQVETVAVTGNSRYTQEEVVQASGIQLGDNLYRLNKNQIYQQIRRSLPYVEKLTIRRSLPSTIVIQVWEWDAVAQIEVSQSASPAPAAAAPDTSGGDIAIPEGDSSEDGSAPGEEQPQAATWPWLISVGGRLLEPAPEDSTAIRVRGLTALSPQAGTPLAVPLEEQSKLDNLLELLSALEELEVMDRVEWIDVSPSTWLWLRYEGRFDVKLPISGEMSRHLRVLMKAVETLEDYETGTMDLTQQDYAVVYAPG